ncbi:nidogen-1 [Kryptolebias marmoratus]|uniref:Nidogen 1a n=1 Tax=Kryptolebias marmoratus TaxID=37003 RepID=A0A3Q3ADB3_KRYMA|nr:nidogen-1 [Kryptolebias marmoratus]
MGWKKRDQIAAVLFFGLLASARSIGRDDLFPFGVRAGDQLLEPGTDQTAELQLHKPLLFYNGAFNRIFINTNGFVATAKPVSESTYLGKMPPEFGMIATLQGDLDTSDGAGEVFFRQDSSPDVLRLAAKHINRAFPRDDEVNPTDAVVITWVNVARHEPQTLTSDKKRNNFQLVIASLETVSYAIVLYPRNGIQFSSTPVGDDNVISHAGFSKGLIKGIFFNSQGEYYRTTTDDEASVRALAEETNSGLQGVWVYEIGTYPYFSNIRPGEVTDLPTEAPLPALDSQQSLLTDGQVIISPDAEQIQIHSVQYQPNNPEVVEIEGSDINVDVFSYNLGTCANNRNKCSQFADCRDYSSGFCCHCRPGYYGNGIQCLAEGKPQRMNGKLHGKLYAGHSQAPVEFSGNDLHSYVVVNDGRSYVAISGIPESVGFSMAPLLALSSVIGWTFALEQPGFRNGFNLMGGEFTRLAEVTFVPGNERLTIRQEFKGTDELDHLVVSTTVDGRVPEVPPGATVQVEPYTDIYQYSNNLIASSSTRNYVLTLPDGSTETRSYQCRETITFQSCQYDQSFRDVDTQMLKVDQLFAFYDSNNNLLRYAMSNKIGDVNGGQPEENPCFTGRHGCDTNAVCKPGDGIHFVCTCAAGFSGDGRACYDIDECRETPQICGPNAVCNNQPGTFRCECEEGFQFGSDGRTCIEVDQPVDHCADGTHTCDVSERAQCSYTGGSSYHCSCLQGFVGDGRTCQDIDECQPGRCHLNAACINTQGSFICQCLPGYSGNGVYCSSERTKTRCESHRDSLLGGAGLGPPRGPRPPVGHYIPECNVNGDYEPMQCHSSTGYCWCVDRNGLEIAGTRSAPGHRPMCVDHNIGPTPVGPRPRPDVTLPPGTHLLFAQSGRVEHVPLDGYDMKKNDAKPVLHLPGKVIIGVAFDCVEKMIYWTEITSPSISKASVDGGEPTAVIRSDLESPEGIAIDHLSRTMFWTDSMRDRIEVASLDGSQRRVLVDNDLVNPRAIIADPENGNLYWADWNRDAPKIETSYMDGSNRRVLVKDNLGLPNGLTYDYRSSLLCWADAGTHKLECVNPGRGDRSTVLEGIRYPFGITTVGKNIFYTDWQRDSVVGVDRYTGEESDEFHPQKRTRPYGITTAYAQCLSGQNYCSVNNGGCTHLCLPTPTGRSCRCPDNAAAVGCVESDH